MKKTLLTIGIIVAIIGVSAGLYFLVAHNNTIAEMPLQTVSLETPEPKSPSLATDEGTFCFIRGQIAIETAPYASTEHIIMTRTGNVIFGTKSGIQSGSGMSNGYTGTLEGSINDNAITSIFSYTIEGSQGKEQEEYRVTNTELIKHHYQLKDVKGIQVPDVTQPERDPLIYTPEPCKDSASSYLN